MTGTVYIIYNIYIYVYIYSFKALFHALHDVILSGSSPWQFAVASSYDSLLQIVLSH